jgi:hypothetical protein
MGAVQDYLSKEYGGLVGCDESVVAVPAPGAGVIPVSAAPGDDDRLVITFSNAGANAILLGIKSANQPGSGILLPVNSAPYTVSVWDDGSLSAEQWWASALVGASTLHVLFCKRITSSLAATKS